MARWIDIDPIVEKIKYSLSLGGRGEYNEGYDAALNTVLDYINDELALTPQNEPLSIKKLREMDGQPAWWDDGEGSCWGIISVDTNGQWAGIPFFCGRWNQANFEYDIEGRKMKIYRRPPEE